MRDMIYFPGFEVRNESWLKFALLYFDTLRPIFPDTWHSRAIPLGDASRTVMGETDLIRPYHASPEEGHRAAILACGEFEKILSHPQLYRPYFRGASHGASIEHWREPAFQNSTLFEGKYSPEFFKFCIEQRIATPCEVGIHISSDLTFVYMSLLANVISRQNNYEMITDTAKYSHYLNDRELALCKTSNLVFETAKSSIELALPANLRSIPLERFVQLRKDKSFSAARRAYLAQIEKMVARQEQGDYSDFEELVSCKREFRKICEQFFELSAAAVISGYSLCTLAQGSQEHLPLAAASAVADLFTGKRLYWELPQHIKDFQEKRLARRFVAQLRTLHRPPPKNRPE